MAELVELPFDQYQRYRTVGEIVEILKREAGMESPLRVLDVGGYNPTPGFPPLLIAEFLPGDITYVLDTVECKEPDYIQGDGIRLPFADEAFDVVISCDTLEHVVPEHRPAFIGELLRATRHFVILTAPFDKEETRLAERIFSEYVIRLGWVHGALTEHLVHGLPDREKVCALLNREGLAFISFPSGYLYNWLLMMIIKHHVLSLPDSAALHTMIDRLYNIAFAAGDQRAPAYREVFVIDKKGRKEALEIVQQCFAHAPNAMPWEDSWKIALLQLLTTLIDFGHRQLGLERVDINNPDAGGTAGKIWGARSVGQTFVCHQANLCRVDLLLATYARPAYHDLIFHLKESPAADEDLATVVLPAPQIQDNRWHSFRFPPLIGSRHRRFYFYVESPASSPDEGITVYKTCQPLEDGRCYENHQPVHGSLAFRTYYLPTRPEDEWMEEVERMRRVLSVCQRELEQKDQEIQILCELVDGFRRGRVMRLMLATEKLVHRLGARIGFKK